MARKQTSRRPRTAPALPRPQTRISACLIVRQEEKHIGRCLDSLKGKVDQIVIIDTGSTDDTKLVALQHMPDGDHIVGSVFWIDDFSYARNVSIEQATGDFILWIDADEELRETKPGDLRRLVEGLEKDVDAVYLRVWCPTDEDNRNATFADQARLFRNHIGFTFNGRIHEQLVLPAGRSFKKQFAESPHIYHHGYIPDGDSMERKFERNTRILLKAIEEEPDNHANHYYYAKTLLMEEKWTEAAESFNHAIKLWEKLENKDVGHAPSMFSGLCYALLKLEWYSKVIEVAKDVPEWVQCCELWYAAGMAAFYIGNLLDAEDALKKAMLPNMMKSTGMDPGTNSWKPALQLAHLYTSAGQNASAQAVLAEGLNRCPGRPELLEALAAFQPTGGGITINGKKVEKGGVFVVSKLPWGIMTHTIEEPGGKVMVELLPGDDYDAIVDHLNHCEHWKGVLPKAS